MDAIQFGIFMIVGLAIGLYTPPVGTVLFVTCNIGNITIEKAVKAILPFMGAMTVIAPDNLRPNLVPPGYMDQLAAPPAREGPGRSLLLF
jgi:hypothetical protein